MEVLGLAPILRDRLVACDRPAMSSVSATPLSVSLRTLWLNDDDPCSEVRRGPSEVPRGPPEADMASQDRCSSL